MQIGKHFYIQLLLIIICFTQTSRANQSPKSIALKSETISMRVALMLRFDDKYNKTTIDLVRGIETAAFLYQKKYHHANITLTRFPHSKKIDEIISAAKKIAKQDISAVIGGEMSGEAMAMAEVFNNMETVFMTPTATSPEVTYGRPFSFRGCIADNQVANKLAQFSSTHLKPTSIGVLHNISYPYTDYLSLNFANELRSYLPETSTIHVEKVVKGSNDFTEQISRFQAKGVTHIAMLTYDGDLRRFFSQAASRGYFPQYIGSDGWGSPQSVYETIVAKEKHGEKLVGYINSYWKIDQSSEFASEFSDNYLRMHKMAPTPWSAVAFDTAWVLFEAIRRSSGARGSLLRDSLKTTEMSNLVTSKKFKFGPDNTPLKDLFIYKISSSGPEFLTTK